MTNSSASGRRYESKELVEISFSDCGADTSFRLLHDVVVPRPVFLVSTVSRDGVNNVAPFSLVTLLATAPATFTLGVVHRGDGTEKDTLVNARASGELVINAVTEQLVHAANACAEHVPASKSEFEVAGLTPAFFASHAPHVAESPIRLECSVEKEIPVGRGAGGASLLILSLLRAYVAKSTYRGRGELDVAALRLIGRSSVEQYLVADGLFTIGRSWAGEPYTPSVSR